MIIGLEGHSYTGKSSLLGMIGKIKRFTVIPETDVYAGGIENYPPFPALTEQMAIDNIDFFVALEDQRKNQADNSSGTMVVDRIFISTPLFQKFIKQLERKGWYDSLEYAKTLYHQRIDEGRLIIPDAMCLVTCASDADYESRLGREISVTDMRTIKAYRFFTGEYTKLLEGYRKIGRLVEFVNYNGEESLQHGTYLIEQLKIPEMNMNQKKRIAHEMLECL
jgi:hypothetical protein